MENEQNNSDVKISISKNQIKKLKIGVIVLLLIMPLIYLYYKTKDIPEKVGSENVNVVSPSSNISAMEKAVAENPTYDNLVNLSMAYINNQMPGKSIDHLKRAIELNPQSAIAYNNLGVAYIMLQQYNNGISACKKALEINPGFQLAKNNLKWGKDEYDKVVNEISLQEKVATSKSDIAFYFSFGSNYFKIGDYGKSIEIWNKIFELDPKNIEALNSIGTGFMMKGQIDDAIAVFKKALEIEPNNQLAKNNLAWAMQEKSKK